MTQVHKRFTAEQVKILFQGYCQGNLSRPDVEEMLGIGKTRFFALLKTYPQDPDVFSIAYLRSTQGRLSGETENQIKQELLRDKALIDDEELPIHYYSYAALADRLKKQGIQVSTTTVIKRAKALKCYRLNLGDQHKQPRLIDADGEPVKLFIRPGETVIHPNLYYLGTVKVNLIGYWRLSLSNPVWIMTSLEPKRGLEIFLQRMKIEQTFRDCKDLLHLTKLMNKKQPLLEHMIALSLLVYVVGVWFGEAVRDVVYGKLDIAQLLQALLAKPLVNANAHPKWLLYSGLFILLKQKFRLPSKQIDAIATVAAVAFGNLIYGNVRSFV